MKAFITKGKESNSINKIFIDDKINNTNFELNHSENYTTLKINGRFYHFVLKTGEFDGTSRDCKLD